MNQSIVAKEDFSTAIDVVISHENFVIQTIYISLLVSTNSI